MKPQWPDFKFPPINLFTAPNQDKMLEDITRLRLESMLLETTVDLFHTHSDSIEAKIKLLNLIYFCRNGHYPNE